ncbi:MAG: formimidoylglutamase [Sediminibacterium sp.]|jgi:formiminoglutamase|uniref:formimidoylglutamase n=1 Tax=Sediminibacterium sp. TaxID=1917865 RepID=UPI002ABB9BD8|nr:formimidoylglutamase [Sediminibacterium sp.]MDZ4072649.1 formimidoylglutamase [Sediminibacterium sp.]
MSLDTIIDFLEPVNIAELSNDEGYKDTQMGKHIAVYDDGFPDIDHADLVIVGCGEMRGAGIQFTHTDSPNAIRSEFYRLYHWHTEVNVADLGNVKCGATLQDSYAALRMVLQELLSLGKKVLILGGSHDITTAQYQAQTGEGKIIDAACVDARIDMDMESMTPADNFLVDLFTGMPNYLRHYNHIGFQSYFMHPQMLETIDKLRFDCYRVGKVREDISEMEPAIRNSDLFSFDIAAIQHAHAPANHVTPNGFNGEEACTLMQYAGMSHTCRTIGIYGYIPAQDVHQMTAKQISHLIWYAMDGIQRGKQEASMEDRNAFNEFTLAFAEVETVFLQSKKTGRWWMQLHDGKYIACSYRDYLTASNNDIPERWMRAAERI